MNVVPSVARPRVAGKNHADKTFDRDRVTDFELIPAACDSSMWCLIQLSHCDAPDAARTDADKTQVSSSLHSGYEHATMSPPYLFYVMTGNLPDAGLKGIEVVFYNAGLTLVTRSLTIRSD
jgi:hypothetical protein